MESDVVFVFLNEQRNRNKFYVILDIENACAARLLNWSFNRTQVNLNNEQVHWLYACDEGEIKSCLNIDQQWPTTEIFPVKRTTMPIYAWL